MANSGFVWGIDIGQCGLKALRGRVGENGTVLAESFDFVEFPKILSQQDAEPDELIRDAIKTFLSRNSLRNDRVAICVSGQSGLARFIKLPPVDEKQLPNLVGYEAKQQIPFALEDVVWDYQKLPTIADEDDDFPQTEVGLFAMKRDQVLRLIRPLVDAEIEIDYVQLTPISIFNALVYDEKLSPDDAEADTPPDPNTWYVIFSMGTEASDLVLTNGARVWQRSIPIGGNHFTKQLTTDLKLTFAKAEHTKRNAREAADPRKVFQSMRPIFNDLVTELQRTLGYFRGIEKKARIQKMMAVGNTLKLPGLQPYLEKNLELPVQRIDSFRRLTGPQVVDDPQFRDNALAFPGTYGLVLQGLGLAPLRTNLIPREILKQRMVKRKKPWVAAIAASFLAAFAFNFFFHWRAWNSVHQDDWQTAKQGVQSVQSQSSSMDDEDTKNRDELARLDGLGESAVGSADGRLLWLELLKAITVSLPVDPELKDKIPTLDEKPLLERQEIFIDRMETEYFPNVADWYTAEVSEIYNQQQAERQKEAAGNAAAAPESTPPADPAAAASPDASAPLEGGAWVISITGHHFQHKNSDATGMEYVRKKLLDQLESGTVELPTGEGTKEVFTVKDLGILYPVPIRAELNREFEIHNPKYRPTENPNAMMGERGPNPFGQRNERVDNEPKEKPMLQVPSYEFTVQFCWKQVPLRQRMKLKREAQAQPAVDVAANADNGVR